MTRRLPKATRVNKPLGEKGPGIFGSYESIFVHSCLDYCFCGETNT